MRVAVLGAGNGGVASAFDLARHGHDVAPHAPPEYGENVVAVDKAGEIRATGVLEGFAPVRYAGHDAVDRERLAIAGRLGVDDAHARPGRHVARAARRALTT